MNMACQLVADVGNTDTVFGLLSLSGRDVLANWRISTGVPRTEDEYRVLLRSLLDAGSQETGPIRRGVIGSVVPAEDRTLRRVLSSIVEGPVIQVTARSDLPITIGVEEPLTVGADRILNTLAARMRYGRDTIVVDLGTATTFDCITKEGVFIGGVIAPGVSAGLDWLARSTAKLPRVDFAPPAEVIGRRTEACIRSGVFYSAVGAVETIVERIRESWESEGTLVVGTGGFAPVIGPHIASVDRVEPHLTLEGLGIAGAHLDR
ncbi:MAG: type III pantothenate kinase [Gemmatimonadetes bacterium]|nr:type III pantothenate kinase [Gemmatimonadota bacterium]MYA63172.1 type III pantothenate kinase [Gemmatimonadota bacterium]MYB98097.1 type III pantothenate kinase [Gemmatimonadota bacterium]MYH53318.1 type III pantothenate kinase [Gemmatimonadota bacterium]MYI46119.1 type III pantothenate kinase [Gemmatimonadota bacterium]